MGSLIGALIVAAMRRFSHLQATHGASRCSRSRRPCSSSLRLFWALQTVELWDYADRNTLIPKRSRQRWLLCDPRSPLYACCTPSTRSMSGFIACSCEPQ